MSELRPLESFRSYLQMVARAKVRPRLQPHLEPSDLVQQTLLEAHRDGGAFRGKTAGEQAAWLRQILARNLANAVRDLHAQRRDVARARSLDADGDGETPPLRAALAAGTVTPSAVAEQLERAEQLAAALESLADDRREVVILRHFHGWSLARIAEHTDRTPAAIAGLLHRALRDLRGLLEDLVG